MSIGFSVLIIAAGAIMRWAVTAHVDGISLDTLGAILMIVGGVGLVVSLLLLGPWSRHRVRRVQVQDDRGRGYERVERVSEGGV
ncbi:MAG: hypothetical protein QOK40_2782 [Miltoncostaeaceae bacterium]|jgi:hypothetical protein|nr:hypothetical protein [Miltoncostaeaceae bacterium]